MDKMHADYFSYLGLSKENVTIDKELVRLNEEFDSLVNDFDDDTGAMILKHLADKDKYEEYKKFFKSDLAPFLAYLAFVLSILSFIILGPGMIIPVILLGYASYFGIMLPKLRKKKEFIRDYERDDEILKIHNAELITKLRELKELINLLIDQKEINLGKMRKLGESIIKELTSEMDAEYQELGIDSSIDIDDVKIVIESKNPMELTLKKENKNE